MLSILLVPVRWHLLFIHLGLGRVISLVRGDEDGLIVA